MLCILLSRSATALRVTFSVPPSFQSHLEVLPKHGMVQGESSYSAQLKFTPRASIMEGLTGEGGTLVMPVEVHVVDQVSRDCVCRQYISVFSWAHIISFIKELLIGVQCMPTYCCWIFPGNLLMITLHMHTHDCTRFCIYNLCNSRCINLGDFYI